MVPRRDQDLPRATRRHRLLDGELARALLPGVDAVERVLAQGDASDRGLLGGLGGWGRIVIAVAAVGPLDRGRLDRE